MKQQHYPCRITPKVILLLVPLIAASSSSSSWKGAPWQTRDDGLLEQLRYNDLPPTVFSPTGRLHPVERTMEQVREPQSNLVVALHCQDGMLILSTRPLSPYLNTTTATTMIPGESLTHNNKSSTSSNDSNDNNTSTTDTSLVLLQTDDSHDILPIMDLSPTVVAATAGKPLDSQVLRLRLQSMAQQLMEDDLDLPSADDQTLATKLARSLADRLQIQTQKTNTRQGPLLASAAIIMGDHQLWRVDPTGQFWNCHAAIVGRESDKMEEAIVTKLLERMATENVTDMGDYLKSLPCPMALELLCDCLQNVFWPSNLNLHRLPPGVQATIPSIPWVAVTLPFFPSSPPPSSSSSSLSKAPRTMSTRHRLVQRGAFIPPILQTQSDSDETLIIEK